MESNEKPKPIISTSSNDSISPNNHNGVQIQFGAMFGIGMIGTISILSIFWIVRKLFISSSKRRTKHVSHKQDQLNGDQFSVSRDTTLRQSSSRSLLTTSDDRTSTTNASSNNKVTTPSENKTVENSTNDVIGNSSFSRNLATKLQQQNNALVWSSQQQQEIEDVLLAQPSIVDGNDSFTSRLYENCVRLQQSIFSPSMLTTTSTTLNNVQQQQQRNDTQRVQEYRRACYPKHLHFQDIVPSDVELGFVKSKKKSKQQSSQKNKSNKDNDELLNPSQRDVGIISRYFGTTTRGVTNESDTNSLCPSNVSISSQSSSSSSSSSSLFYNHHQHDVYNYDAVSNAAISKLYHPSNDTELYVYAQPLGELVDI